jgi:glycosyltransferase involved in cell wall biosynthesis
MACSTLAADSGMMAAVGPLARELSRCGAVVTLAGPVRNGDKCATMSDNDSIRVVPHGPWPRAIRNVVEAWQTYGFVSAWASDEPPRLVHVHGVWTAANVAACRCSRALGLPYVVSPHGMLMPAAMRRSQTKKRWALWAGVRRNLEEAAVVHVTSDAEAEAVHAVAPAARTRVIPWGVDVREQAVRTPSHSGRIAACIGRILPLKGVDELVDAWVEAQPAGWELRFVGPDPEGHGRKLGERIKTRGIHDSVSIHPALDHDALLRMIDTIDLLVVASHSENFGMVVAEALAAGVPVITTTATPWQDVIERRCGWCVPDTVPALATALRDACGRDTAELEAMGKRGREWMQESFAWPVIARRFYEEIYQAL